MAEQRRDRRKVNQAVGPERRGAGHERRSCPDCGSIMRQGIVRAPGGTMTRLYCTKCDFQSDSRQVDEDRLKALAGFEMSVQGNSHGAFLELDRDFLKVAGLKLGDGVELKPVYTPGKDAVLTWV
ncbi:MAG: hypothetical protein ACREKE_04470, partial [bacterium]